jgi:undecaprenyl-diphosphatase
MGAGTLGRVLALASQQLITTFQAIVLGVLQGATELFPVSSLGHTVLFPTLFRWHNVVAWQSQPESPWLAFVVMLHVGSAVGLLIYFWRDWVAIVKGFFATLRKRRIETPTERLAWLIICATIPVGILGLLLEHPVRVALARPLAAAIFLMVNGCILLWGERWRRRAEVRELATREGLNAEGGRRLDTLDLKEAGVIGTAQTSALIAGISRDGVCMTVGLGRGLDHSDSARFAFLLATPPILAAGLLKFGDLTGRLGNGGVRSAAVIAAIAAALTAIVCVHYLTNYFKTRTLTPFGIYCLVFGAFMVVFTIVVGPP